MNNDSIKESNDKFLKESVLDIVIEETTNPLDIAGLKEVNNNVKSIGGPSEHQEGGQGSGRHKGAGGSQGPSGNAGGNEGDGNGFGAPSGPQPGELMTFETTHLNIIKEMVDAKLKCRCKQNK